MISANKKGALLFVSGLVLGGLVSANHWSAQEQTQHHALEKYQAEFAELNSQIIFLKQANEVLNVEQQALISKSKFLAAELANKNDNINLLQTALDSEQTSLETKNAELEQALKTQSEAIARLKHRMADTDYLYAERYRLSDKVNALREQITKDTHKMSLNLKACEEHKKGNSWNRVSQGDCDAFDILRSKNEARMAEFDDVSADLDRIKRELLAFDGPELAP